MKVYILHKSDGVAVFHTRTGLLLHIADLCDKASGTDHPAILRILSKYLRGVAKRHQKASFYPEDVPDEEIGTILEYIKDRGGEAYSYSSEENQESIPSVESNHDGKVPTTS